MNAISRSVDLYRASAKAVVLALGLGAAPALPASATDDAALEALLATVTGKAACPRLSSSDNSARATLDCVALPPEPVASETPNPQAAATRARARRAARPGVIVISEELPARGVHAIVNASLTDADAAPARASLDTSPAPRAAEAPFERTPPVLLDAADREFYESITRPPGLSACREAGLGPSVGACLALGGLTPEVAGLGRLACLLDAVQRYQLAVVECAQQQADAWQEAVMWPRSLLGPLHTAVMTRVQTLREQAETLLDEWQHSETTRPLAAVYVAPTRLERLDYERAWGASRGPARDQLDLEAWLSLANRNAIQGRTSAAFGIAGELPEQTWERIGREGTRMLAESRHDPLAALRHTPQMLADRVRVETNTTRLDAQALVTEQVLREHRRLERRRARALGDLFLRPLAEAAERSRALRSSS